MLQCRLNLNRFLLFSAEISVNTFTNGMFLNDFIYLYSLGYPSSVDALVTLWEMFL
jgi:hypothetical protein